MRRLFQALTTIVSVIIDDDVPGGDAAQLIVAGYPEADAEPELAFHLRGGPHPALVCAGRYETPVRTAQDLVPLFELDLYHLLVEHARPGWLLHAAALERGEAAVVLAGPSGAGKTTLALALLARGWRLVTEEIVLIERSGLVTGLARPIHVASESTRAAIPPDWTRAGYAMHSSQGAIDVLVAQPPSRMRATRTLPLHALARIGHGHDMAASVEVMAPHVALASLWECTLRQDDDGLAAATAILASQRACKIGSASVGEAVALVESLVTG